MKGLQKRENKTGDLQTANPLFFIRLRNLLPAFATDAMYGQKQKTKMQYVLSV